jgi:hypothetical protein
LVDQRTPALRSTVYCADSFAGKARSWELEFPWVAYCAPFLGGMTQDKCGKLLRITNASGGMRLIVRVVDSCGNNGKQCWVCQQ